MMCDQNSRFCRPNTPIQNRRNQSAKTKPTICFYCRAKDDHLSHNCTYKKQGGGECFSCSRFGHIALNCPERKARPSHSTSHRNNKVHMIRMPRSPPKAETFENTSDSSTCIPIRTLEALRPLQDHFQVHTVAIVPTNLSPLTSEHHNPTNTYKVLTSRKSSPETFIEFARRECIINLYRQSETHSFTRTIYVF